MKTYKRFDPTLDSEHSESGISLIGLRTSSMQNLGPLKKKPCLDIQSDSNSNPKSHDSSTTNSSTTNSSSSSSSNPSTWSEATSPIVARKPSLPSPSLTSESSDPPSQVVRMLPTSPPSTPPRPLGEMTSNSLLFIRESFRPNDSGSMVRHRQGNI